MSTVTDHQDDIINKTINHTLLSEDFSAYEDKAEREALESRARAEMFVTSMPRLFRELVALGGGLSE